MIWALLLAGVTEANVDAMWLLAIIAALILVNVLVMRVNAIAQADLRAARDTNLVLLREVATLTDANQRLVTGVRRPTPLTLFTGGEES